MVRLKYVEDDELKKLAFEENMFHDAMKEWRNMWNIKDNEDWHTAVLNGEEELENE